MDFSDIIYEKSDRIATVTFNRPEKMNAWTPKMGVETRAAVALLSRSIRIVSAGDTINT